MSKSSVRVVDHGWTAFFRSVEDLRTGMHVKVGVLGDSERGGLHQTDPTTGKAAPLTVAEIAAVNEYGTEDGHIPSRPAFRDTFDRMRDELVEDIGRGLVKVLIDRTLTAEQMFNLLGLKLATGIRKTITAGDEVPPPNAPSTVARKEAHGTTKGARARGWGVRTLIDTGRLVGAISWAIVKDGAQQAAQYVTKG